MKKVLMFYMLGVLIPIKNHQDLILSVPVMDSSNIDDHNMP